MQQRWWPGKDEVVFNDARATAAPRHAVPRTAKVRQIVGNGENFCAEARLVGGPEERCFSHQEMTREQR